MKGEVSDTIMVIGILALVFITVSMAYISLDQVSLPQDEDQTVSGHYLKVSGDLSKLVESCWRQAGKGSRSQQMDCFDVKIYSNGTVHRSNISGMLEIPEENFGFPGETIPDGESRVKITYYPVDKNVNISIVSSCRPSSGDTCFSLECSCKTACGPGFDPDGDGSTETNDKGCITDYSFEPAPEPCESLSCPLSSYRSGNLNGDKFSFDIGENIGLREVRVMEKPVPSSGKTLEAEAGTVLSPRDKVGYGSVERTLFTGEASINVSSLDTGEYGVFVWGCDSDTVPKNCRWLDPFSFEKTN